MADQLNKLNPTVLVDFYFITTLRYCSHRDIVLGGNSYRGDLTSDPDIPYDLTDIWYGVQEGGTITLEFNNKDNGINDTWDDIVRGQDIRGSQVLIQTYEPTDGTTFVARGKITGYAPGNTFKIFVSLRTEPVFEMLIPKDVITAETFSDTAYDGGKPISIVFGNAPDVPLRSIQNDMVNNYYDYSIGYGPIQGIRYNPDLGLGVKRWWTKEGASVGVICHEHEYTFYDGTQASPFPGYAFLRFEKEQLDSHGNAYYLTADIQGLKMDDGDLAHIDDGNNYFDVWVDSNGFVYVARYSAGLSVYEYDKDTGAFTLKDTDYQSGITNYYMNVWGDGTYIYCATDSGLLAYSFNGTSLTFITRYASATDEWVWGDGTYLYNVGTAGIRALTFNGTAFTSIAARDDGGIYYRVWGDGTYIYCATSNGTRAYTFNGTVFSASLAVATDGGGHHFDVWGDGTYIYVAESTHVYAYTFSGVAFTLVGTHTQTYCDYKGVMGDGDYLYVSNRDYGLEALGFDGSDFVLKDTILIGEARKTWIHDGVIYSASFGDGLYAVEFTGTFFTTPNQNRATVLKNLLSNTTWGAGEDVDDTSFATAAASLPLDTWVCDGSISKKRQLGDVLDDLQFPMVSLERGSDGEWEVAVDVTGRTSQGTFGFNDGLYNNIAVINDIYVTPADRALQTAVINYHVSGAGREPLKTNSIDVFDFGVTKNYTLPFVSEDVTANKVLSYLKNKALVSDQKINITLGTEGRDRDINEVITVEIPNRGIGVRTAFGDELDNIYDGSDSYWDVIVHGNVVFAACGTDGLRAYSWDGMEFVLLDTIDDGGDYYNVWTNDGATVFCACGSDGVRAYSWDSDTETLALLDTQDDGGTYYDVWYDKTTVFCACGGDGVRAYSWDSDTETLALLDTQDDGGTYASVTGNESYIFCACAASGVRAYTFDGATFSDVIDTQADGSGLYYDVCVQGDTVFCACEGDGVRAYSWLSNTFTLLDTIDSGGNYRSVWSNGDNIIYTACFGDGVRAYDWSGSAFSLFDTQDNGGNYQGVTGSANFIFCTAATSGLRAYRALDRSQYQIESMSKNGVNKFQALCSKYVPAIYKDEILPEPSPWGTPPVVGLGPETVFPTPPDDNLVAHFGFDSTQGTTAINSIDSTNNGTLTGTWIDANWVQGIVQGGLDFPGTDQYVVIDEPLLDATEFVISVWVYKEAYNANQAIFADWDTGGHQNILIYEDVENSLTCKVGNGVTEEESTYEGVFTVGWHHIVVHFKGATSPGANDGILDLFVDLQLKSRNDLTIGDINGTQSTYCAIGRYMTTAYFEGIIDELRMYNAMAQQPEISALYYNPAATGKMLESSDKMVVTGDIDFREYGIDNVGDIIHDDAVASDWTLKNADQDKDIMFNVNDGGVDTEIMRIGGANGVVRIGTTDVSSATKLGISLGSPYTSLGGATNEAAQFISATQDQGGTRAVFIEAEIQDTIAGSNACQGFNAFARLSCTANNTSGSIRAGNYDVRLRSSVSYSATTCLNVKPYNAQSGTPTITAARGIVIDESKPKEATITDEHKILIRDSATPTGAGSITNQYGIYISDLTVATNNYAIKTRSGLVEFGDDCTIGGGSSDNHTLNTTTATGTQTPSFTNNLPAGAGSTTPADWIELVVNGTLSWTPVWQ